MESIRSSTRTVPYGGTHLFHTVFAWILYVTAYAWILYVTGLRMDSIRYYAHFPYRVRMNSIPHSIRMDFIHHRFTHGFHTLLRMDFIQFTYARLKLVSCDIRLVQYCVTILVSKKNIHGTPRAHPHTTIHALIHAQQSTRSSTQHIHSLTLANPFTLTLFRLYTSSTRPFALSPTPLSFSFLRFPR
jgi:hypothetical protein